MHHTRIEKEEIAMYKRRLCVAILLVVFLLAGISIAIAQDDPPPPPPGTVEGTGTYFEVTDSEYLNVTLESTEPMQVMLESVPQMVVMHLEAADGATSTQITLGGFLPLTTYYKYEDDYHNKVALTTDANGGYSYVQDLSEPHLVFIQTQPSTKFIRDDETGGDCTLIGDWDGSTKTCTLTMNVNETIQIDSDYLTLDGAGYMVSGQGTGYGIYLPHRTGVTVKNLNVEGFTYGILLSSSSSNTLEGNTASNNFYGITLSGSDSNTLEGNTADSNNYHGIYLDYSDNNTLTGNTASNNLYGIRFYYYATNNTLVGNTASNNSYGIYFYYANSNTLVGNTASSNNHSGIYLFYSSSNTLEGNTASNNLYGIVVLYSHSNTLEGNTAASNNFYGIPVSYSGNNTLVGNTTSNSDYGIRLYVSSGNTLEGNTVSNNNNGILLYEAHNNEIYNNNFIDNILQVDIYASSGNVFNLPEPTIGGNYWSDWTGPDADGDGFVDNPYVFDGGQDDLPWTVKNGWVPVWSEQLESQVVDLNLQQGIENSLDAKLETVQLALDDLNANNDVAAINSLRAFINAVVAQRGKKIPEEDADALIAAAQAIIAALESQ